MRYLLMTIFCFIVSITIAQQKAYLPKEVQDLYLGMPKSELIKLHPNTTFPETTEYDYPEEKFEKGDINKILYQIDGADKVFEFIIEYNDTAKAIALAKEMYKVPNDPQPGFDLQWKFTLEDGNTLSTWIFESKICILLNKVYENEK